jgi:hypothetical protein
MKPKSGTGMNKNDTQKFITNSCLKITTHNPLFINTLFINLFFVILLLEKSEIIIFHYYRICSLQKATYPINIKYRVCNYQKHNKYIRQVYLCV